MRTDAQLMATFSKLRKEAYEKLATPLRDAVLGRYDATTKGVKTASELASIDRTMFLHNTVP